MSWNKFQSLVVYLIMLTPKCSKYDMKQMYETFLQLHVGNCIAYIQNAQIF